MGSCSLKALNNWKRVMKAINNFACNITHVSQPLRREILIHKKRNQVNTDNHVFIII